MSKQKERVIQALRAILITRCMDDKKEKLVRQNKGATFHLSVKGHEMIGALCGLALKPGVDWGLPYYRDRAFAIGFGCSPTELLGAFLARAVSHHSGGRMMPEHFSDKERNIPCQSSVVGSQFLQAVGVAKGLQLQGKNEIVYVSAGDGATSQGDFHEALNFSCIHKLPVLFVIQDNGWAISVPIKEQTAGGSILPLVKSYAGLTVHDIDGCDYMAVSGAIDEAVAKGKAGKGPSLIVASVPRIGAHSNSDDPRKYKEEEHFAEDLKRDPVPRFKKWIVDEKILTEEEIEAIHKECFDAVEMAAKEADQIPYPDPLSVTEHVFAKGEEFAFQDVSPSKQESVVIVDAINSALNEEMAKDPSICVFGQDVAHGKGGVFGVTRGLTEKFGVERCFNTPLAESTIMGIATGMSFTGMKPVAEVQFADYIWTGMNQLMNEMASVCYRSNGEWNCPIVARMPYGGYIQGGPYHSQSIEATLAHCPGLKVVIPSNASDAKRLLKAAIRDPNPVVFLEHKGLYRQRLFCARPEPEEDEILPLGKAYLAREGDDVTVVTWGMTTVFAVEVADTLSKEGISAEVIDLRTIVPFDVETVIASLKKTGKLLIVHEAVRTCGFASEVAMQISEKAFEYLDAPPQRLTANDCMVSYSKILEDAHLPQKGDVEKAIRELALY